MAKIQAIKRIISEIIIIIALCQIAGFYAITIWGKKTNKPLSCTPIYQGAWIWSTKKIGDFWSVGYLEIIKK